MTLSRNIEQDRDQESHKVLTGVPRAEQINQVSAIWVRPIDSLEKY